MIIHVRVGQTRDTCRRIVVDVNGRRVTFGVNSISRQERPQKAARMDGNEFAADQLRHKLEGLELKVKELRPKEKDKDAAAACKLESYESTPSYEV